MKEKIYCIIKIYVENVREIQNCWTITKTPWENESYTIKFHRESLKVKKKCELMKEWQYFNITPIQINDIDTSQATWQFIGLYSNAG